MKKRHSIHVLLAAAALLLAMAACTKDELADGDRAYGQLRLDACAGAAVCGAYSVMLTSFVSPGSHGVISGSSTVMPLLLSVML